MISKLTTFSDKLLCIWTIERSGFWHLTIRTGEVYDVELILLIRVYSTREVYDV